MSSPGASRAKVSGCSAIRPGEVERHGVCGGGTHWPLGGSGVSDLLWAVISPRRPLLPAVEWARICPTQPGRFFPGPATNRSNDLEGDRHSGWLYSTRPSLLPLPPPHPNQLAEPLSEMHFRCGYNSGKPSADTADAPPGEWTPGPRSFQPVSQPLPYPSPLHLSLPASSPPPLHHPFRYAVLTSARVSTHRGC